MRSKRAIVLFSLLLATAGPAAAQQPAVDMETIRQILLNGFEQNKLMDLDYCEAMPPSGLRFAPTEGVRDFAQQITHISESYVFALTSAGVVSAPPPAMGDSAAYLNDVPALEEAITKSYDWVLESLRQIPAAELAAETELFGMKMAKWQVYNFVLTHAYWTRGQLVPYLRMNGATPPQYRPY
jgi:uncharacterized damage-inducible protein DinB